MYVFKRLIDTKGFVRILETHSPLSAIIAEKLSIKISTEKLMMVFGQVFYRLYSQKTRYWSARINERLKILIVLTVATKP